jgi:hypothetical protein
MFCYCKQEFWAAYDDEEASLLDTLGQEFEDG